MISPDSGLPYPRRAIATIVLSLGSLVLMIDASIAGVVMPTIATSLRVENSQAMIVVTLYQLVLVMALMPFAALGARIGYRRLYCGGLILHGLTALLLFFVETLVPLIVIRGLQAVGTAASLSVAFGLLRDIYPVKKLGQGMAINTIANASGTALAPVIGGLIIAFLSWQWVFSVVIPLSIVVIVFSRFLPNEAHPQTEPFDLRGAVLCAMTFGVLIGGLELFIHSNQVWLALGIVCFGVVIARLLVCHESKQSNPVLPIDMLAQPKLAFTVIGTFSAVLSSTTLILYMPFLLQLNYGFSASEIGGLIAAYAIASVMIAPTSGYFSDRVPVALLCTTGMLIAVIGLTLITLMPEAPSHFSIAWRLWLCGAGFGMFFAPNARFIVGSVPTARAAAAGSLVATTRMLGQALAATMTATLLVLNPDGSAVSVLLSVGLAVIAGGISMFQLRQ